MGAKIKEVNKAKFLPSSHPHRGLSRSRRVDFDAAVASAVDADRGLCRDLHADPGRDDRLGRAGRHPGRPRRVPARVAVGRRRLHPAAGGRAAQRGGPRGPDRPAPALRHRAGGLHPGLARLRAGRLGGHADHLPRDPGRWCGPALRHRLAAARRRLPGARPARPGGRHLRRQLRGGDRGRAAHRRGARRRSGLAVDLPDQRAARPAGAPRVPAVAGVPPGAGAA